MRLLWGHDNYNYKCVTCHNNNIVIIITADIMGYVGASGGLGPREDPGSSDRFSTPHHLWRDESGPT